MPPEAGGERTEPATPKRREDTRRKGQIAKTAELGPALALLAVYLVLSRQGALIVHQAETMLRYSTTAMGDHTPLTVGSLQQLVGTQAMLAGQVVVPLLAALLGAAVVSQVAQVGFLASTEALRPKWNRLNPLEGFKRILSKRALIELGRSLLKTGLVIYMAWGPVQEAMTMAPQLMEASLMQAAGVAARLAGALVRAVGMTLLAVAAVDYLYQRWDFLLSIRMTRKEVEDELKQSEGDPHVRSRIRQRQRKLAMSRMMAAIPKADVVVANPVHVAVALRYDTEHMAAPVVVAKGADLLAQRIKEVARQYRVPVVENVALARGIYAGAEVGHMIPPEFYQAVAEVLAFVYQLRRSRGKRV